MMSCSSSRVSEAEPEQVPHPSSSTLPGLREYSHSPSRFSFEGRRKEIAREGYRHIRAVCEHTILVDNDLVLARMPDLTMDRAFGEVNKSIMRHVMDCVAAVEETFIDEVSRQKPVKTTRESSKKEKYPIELLISA